MAMQSHYSDGRKTEHQLCMELEEQLGALNNRLKLMAQEIHGYVGGPNYAKDLKTSLELLRRIEAALTEIVDFDDGRPCGICNRTEPHVHEEEPS